MITTLDDTEQIIVFTDGSCYPNPGHGGWSFYVTHKGKHAVRHGYTDNVTNNAMEVEAIHRALQFIPVETETNLPVVIYTDSKYAMNALVDWIHGWKSSGWKTSNGKPVTNKKSLKAAHKLLTQHQLHREVRFVWCKGHIGIPENELVDKMASNARKQKTTNWSKKDNRNRKPKSATK